MPLRFTERRDIARCGRVSGEQLHRDAACNALEAFTQAQDRQRAIEPTRIDNDTAGRWMELILRHI